MILNFNDYVNEGYYNVPNKPSYHLDASKVRFDKEERSFSVFISDLGKEFQPLLTADKEIVIIENLKTKVSCEYQKKRGAAQYDADNDITHWIYTAKPGSPGEGTKLIIWND
jgi:hypothetical protein